MVFNVGNMVIFFMSAFLYTFLFFDEGSLSEDYLVMPVSRLAVGPLSPHNHTATGVGDVVYFGFRSGNKQFPRSRL
jgi:hypothetical protein